MSYKLNAACLCNTGRVRKNNEDNFFFDGYRMESDNNGLRQPMSMTKNLNQSVCVTVFDGMGGENFGEFASFAAADCMQSIIGRQGGGFIPDRNALDKMCMDINDAVVAKQRELCTERMGSTLVGFAFTRGSVFTYNLGDSRAYRLRGTAFTQLSVDHVERREGKSTRKAPLTQHLGINPEEYLIEPYIVESDLEAGDQYLLCSDGLTDMLSDSEIAAILQETPGVENCVQKLVDAALERGGKDNVTVIICRIQETEESGAPGTADRKRKENAETEAAGLQKRKRIIIGALIGGASLVLLLLICFFTIHKWQPATCMAPETCSICGKTRGEALKHSWKPATCLEPETCENCGVTRGELADHKWEKATCTKPETCRICGVQRGELADHEWADATCTEPQICRNCGETNGEPLGHDWVPQPMQGVESCSRCGETREYGRDALIEHANKAAEEREDYQTVVGETELSVPEESEFIRPPRIMNVAVSETEGVVGGEIGIYPTPSTGLGFVGRVSNGTQVAVYAVEGEYCFFVLEDGRAGWNLTKNFIEAPETTETTETTEEDIRYTHESVLENARKAAENPELEQPYALTSIPEEGDAPAGYKELLVPEDAEFLEEPFMARVNADGKTAIYFMPLPETGHGFLGKVNDGTVVTILAEKKVGESTFCFFVLEDGRAGWNWSNQFTPLPKV